MSAGSGTPKLRLAVYGKGGIGKSTIAANLSAAFAALGKSVLQIGCDPKHDSTRLLLGGRTSETVLEHLARPANQADLIRFRRKALSPEHPTAEVIAAGKGVPEGLERDNVLCEGFGGVLCVEAGGPRPGVGCAGRGVITTFELLQKLNVDPNEFDVVLYDVLGDVVCGGFGVPLRREHANAVLLVTSEEYMPLYAANNILRGVRNYDRDEQRLVGLFLNRRDNDASSALVERFSLAAALPMVAELSRSSVIRSADRLGATTIEAFEDAEEAAVFMRLAERLLDPESPRVAAQPLTDPELEHVVLGRAAPTPVAAPEELHQAPRATSGAPRRVAFYGKGGVGKSTVAANFSAALAARGLRVLQLGCDPKHDSNRLLLGGRTVRTVLEYLRDVCESDRRLVDVVHEGVLGVHCVEVGGPEPGVGCAGRGILSAFTLLEKLGLRDYDYDVIVYDVLGDVVCGGFAIPLRDGYAESVVLVSSEEYMSLYAANNILRGVNGVAGVTPKVLGVFHNARDNDVNPGALRCFAQSVRLPIVARLGRSQRVQQAEGRSQPLALFAPQSTEADAFDRLAETFLHRPAQYAAAPLDDETFDALVLGRATAKPEEVASKADSGLEEATAFTQSTADLRFCNFEQAPHEPFYYRQRPIRQPIWGCAFQSAVLTSLHLRDAVVVAHAPRSCAYMCRAGMCFSSGKALKRRKQFHADPMTPNLVCTDMSTADMIYGGTELLTETLKRVLANRPPVVFLATACPPAIIGDDVVEAMRAAQPVSPETRIIPLRTDGNMTGGGMNGHLSGLFDGLLGVVGPADGAPPEAMSVNLVGDWEHTQSRVVQRILADIGLKVNASFSVRDRNARVDDLRRMNRAPLTLLGSMNFVTALTAKYLKERFGTQLARFPFPRGYRETELWLRDIGAFFGIEQRVDEYLRPRRAAYERTIAEHRDVLKGKRVVVFAWGRPMDWVFDALVDSGLDVAFVGVMARREDINVPSRHWDALPVEFSFHPDRRREVLELHKPDAVFMGPYSELASEVVVLDTVGVSPETVAFEASHTLIRRWARLLAARVAEGWRRDFVPRDKREVALRRRLTERARA